MSEEKKDLTGLLQYSQSLEEAGQAPPLPEGAVLEEAPIEKLEHFESLEDYAASNPIPELPPEPLEPLPPEPVLQEPEAPQQESLNQFELNTPLPSSEEFAITEPPPDLFQTESTPSTPESLPDFQIPAESLASEVAAPDLPLPPSPPSNPSHSSNPSAMEQVKNFSEKLSPAKTAVPAAFPFSLLIQGHLSPEEKDKLLDIISRESMGIREIDLEPQFTSGKILIPRISEYAGVLLVQALRASNTMMKLGPSDTIFSTADTREENDFIKENSPEISTFQSSEISHPAEELPLTSSHEIPGLLNLIVIDTITASALLKSKVIEAESTSQYQEIVEALQREIKYKAYRKGACAITNFKVQIFPLTQPTHFRILAMGTAMKINQQLQSPNL